MSNVDLTIVLPAYREAENLRALLPALRETAAKLTPDFEIIVADTPQALDDTPQVCAANGVIWKPRDGGDTYGDAVRTGIATSRGEFVVFMDADGSHNPRYLADVWNARDGADLVVASRYVPGGQTENPFILIFLSLVVNVVFRIVLGLRCRDVSNSFRLYRGDHLRALRLHCSNFEIIEEILVLLTVQHPGYRIREVPFTFEQRKAGETKRKLLAFALSYFAVLLRLFRLKQKARQEARS